MASRSEQATPQNNYLIDTLVCTSMKKSQLLSKLEDIAQSYKNNQVDEFSILKRL